MKAVHIVHLYPHDMNIYGDTGNRIILENRLKWRGISVRSSLVNQGDKLPTDADIIIGGGGQDKGQQAVEVDLLRKSTDLKKMSQNGVTMLMICGMYQLFGDCFITKDKKQIKGIGILPLHTEASEQRMIGNIVVSTEFGDIVGYENHSGKTYLHEGCSPLGKIVRGYGNNGEDKTEGARLNNVFASYLHGPILSKNPVFADELLKCALNNRGITLQNLDDSLENRAAEIATKRP